MHRRPPLRTLDDLASASADKICDHVRWELRRLTSELGLTQLQVATSIGYRSSGGAFTNWATRRGKPPAEKAKALDAAYPTFELSLPGETFASLCALQAQRRRAWSPPPSHYDAFIASPMAAATEGAYGEERDAAMELADALERFCGFSSIYYAGTRIETPEDFESPNVSIGKNAEALRRSSYFILLVLQPVASPSGVYVEAGMALANGIPSVYFVPHTGLEYLPWMLGTMGGRRTTDLPPVAIEQVRSITEATRRLRQHGREFFDQLDAHNA